MSSEITVEIIDSLSKFKTLETEWDALAVRACDGAPFSSHVWLKTWADKYLKTSELRIILARNRGTLVGAAPLYVTQKYGLRTVQLLGMKHVNADPVSLLIEPGLEDEVGRLLFDTVKNSIGHWDAISFYGVRANSRLHQLLLCTNHQLLYQTRVISRRVGTAPVIKPSGNWDAFLKSASKNFRHNYQRQCKTCESAGITAVSEQTLQTDSNLTDRLAYVQSHSWQATRGHPIFIAEPLFFKRLFPTLLTAKRAEVIWAIKGDITRPLGFLVILYCGDRAYLYATGYDASLQDLPVGSFVHYRALEQLCNQGIRHIDFLTGSEQYKERWTKTSENSWKHVILRRSFRSKLMALSQL